jgi:hypothetical protein
MADINILGIIFDSLLRLNPSLVTQYSSAQTQLFNLVLIPHIILFLFIYGFAWIIVPTHKGFKYLISIAAYLSMIIMGEPYSLYSMLTPFLIIWWQVALFVGLFFFIWGRFINPSKTPELFNLGKAAAKSLTEGQKKRRALEEEIDIIRRQIAVLQSQANTPGIEPSAKAYAEMQIQNLRARQREYEGRL